MGPFTRTVDLDFEIDELPDEMLKAIKNQTISELAAFMFWGSIFVKDSNLHAQRMKRFEINDLILNSIKTAHKEAPLSIAIKTFEELNVAMVNLHQYIVGCGIAREIEEHEKQNKKFTYRLVCSSNVLNEMEVSIGAASREDADDKIKKILFGCDPPKESLRAIFVK